MTVESATYVNDLNASYPASGDVKSEGDDHLRNLKTVLKNTFPGMAGAFARTQSKGTNYTVVANDNTTLITATAALTLNLTAAATLGNKHTFAVYAQGGTVTIDPSTTEQINGLTTLVIPAGSFALVWCTGAAFHAMLATQTSVNPFVADGRLTLVSGVPVSPTNQTAKTTLYYTPYRGNVISLYNGAGWIARQFSELSIAVPASTNTNYDAFIYDNSGTPTFELTAWTDDTTRATALTTQDGVWCKSGALTRRYVGSFRTTGTSGQTEDSDTKRFVWNCYNQCPRRLLKTATTASWLYSTATWRQANNDATNQVEWIQGLTGDAIKLAFHVTVVNADATAIVAYAGISLDEITSPGLGTIWGGKGVTNVLENITNEAVFIPLSVGKHFAAWCEYAVGGTLTWHGTTYGPSGIVGSLLA